MPFETESTYGPLLENALDAAFLTKPDGTILYANPAACTMFGYTLDEFRTLGRDAIVDPNDVSLVAALAQRRQTGKFSGILRFLRKDRSPLAVEISSAVFTDSTGELRTSIFARDITEREKTEKALRDSESLCRGIIDNLLAIMLIIDPDSGNIVYANSVASAFYGWSHEQLISMNIGDINTLTRDELKEQLKAARLTNRTYFQFKHRRADGTTRDVEVYSGPIEFSGRTLLHSIIHDIVDRKKAEGALIKSEEKFSKLFKATPTVISVSTLSDGRLIDVNKEYEKVFKYQREEILGRTSYELGIWVDIKDREHIVRMIQEEGRVRDQELKLQSKDRVIHTFRYFAEPIELDNTSCLLSAFVDITGQKQAEQERDKLIENLQKALAEIKTLRGILPICSYCKRIRDDKGAWTQLEAYISQHTEADFSHGYCPECAKKVADEFKEMLKNK